MESRFLDLPDVLMIHADQIARYGGSPEIRDAGLLASAVAVARAGFAGEPLHADHFEVAAAYLFHIVQNHPFVDGNKRTGLATALVFLDGCGVAVEASDDALVDLVLDVAQGRLGKHEIAEFLHAHSQPV